MAPVDRLLCRTSLTGTNYAMHLSMQQSKLGFPETLISMESSRKERVTTS
ncbi:Uncharacterised protein [Mycobacterium tuberculosis]|nr:Uncharacterised protein [Mycobacterium tuberculosis]